MGEWDLWRVVLVAQPDRATQERVQAAFEDEARQLGCDIAHERTYGEDGNWRGEVYIVATTGAARRLRAWREVKSIKPAK